MSLQTPKNYFFYYTEHKANTGKDWKQTSFQVLKELKTLTWGSPPADL